MAKKGAGDMQLDQLKERQRMTWETGDYIRIGATLQIVSELLCEQTDLRAGSTVLDGCIGSGNTAIAAARRGCRVTRVDFSPQSATSGKAGGLTEVEPLQAVRCCAPRQAVRW